MEFNLKKTSRGKTVHGAAYFMHVGGVFLALTVIFSWFLDSHFISQRLLTTSNCCALKLRELRFQMIQRSSNGSAVPLGALCGRAWCSVECPDNADANADDNADIGIIGNQTGDGRNDVIIEAPADRTERDTEKTTYFVNFDEYLNYYLDCPTCRVSQLQASMIYSLVIVNALLFNAMFSRKLIRCHETEFHNFGVPILCFLSTLFNLLMANMFYGPYAVNCQFGKASFAASNVVLLPALQGITSFFYFVALFPLLTLTCRWIKENRALVKRERQARDEEESMMQDEEDAVVEEVLSRPIFVVRDIEAVDPAVVGVVGLTRERLMAMQLERQLSP